MPIYFLGDGVDELVGIVKVGVAEELQQAVVTILLLAVVLCLVQPVGVDEEGAALDAFYLLTLILQSGPEADGGIGQHVEEVSVMLAAADDGCVVAGIAEVEVPCRQVQQPDEHGDEHGILVVGTRQLAVEQGAYLGGLLALSGQ